MSHEEYKIGSCILCNFFQFPFYLSYIKIFSPALCSQTLSELQPGNFRISIRVGNHSAVPQDVSEASRYRSCKLESTGSGSTPSKGYCISDFNLFSQNQKTHVPGFSPKYFTIWGRNMDTKHTTGEQITGN
jgi:hypothetical protein